MILFAEYTMHNRAQIIVVIVATLLFTSLTGCNSGDSSNSSPTHEDDTKKTDPSALSPPTTTRDWLTFDGLMSASYPHSSPIHNDYFMPVGTINPALHDFSGRINITAGKLMGNFPEYQIAGDESFKNFPDVDLSFVSDGDALIPLNRDRQVTLSDNSYWGIILEPGRVWSEPTDNGWSRASFPFTFISARRNQGHNGLATFLYNDDQISHLRIQIVQETALWFKKDIYAQLSVSYLPQGLPSASTVIDAYHREVDNTVAIKDWSALATIGDSANMLEFNSYLKDSDINQTGFIKDGVVYLQPCYTRFGNYPYCRWMRNGAYSMTKSLSASLTLLRLAQLFGDSVYDLKIADYLIVTALHNGWDEVTFGDVLNMAAGIGDEGRALNSGDIFADENGPKMEQWIAKNTEQEKLDITFTYGNYDWGPGVEFRYNSALTFVLAAALDNYYKSVAGEQANLWQMMVEDVYHKIGIQHVPMLRTIEPNGEQGIAELFHGLYPNVDDMAKLSALLQNGGRHNGVQLLHQEKLQEALFKTENQGLRSWWADNEFGKSRYLHGFWTSSFINDSGCFTQVPYMSGYGGNIFTILPNGTSAFRFADAESYLPYNMIKVSDKERTICAF
jgi:CubicO group peptidase (beta-lactamase class C family)